MKSAILLLLGVLSWQNTYNDGVFRVGDKVEYVRGTYDPDYCRYGVILFLYTRSALVEYRECYKPYFSGKFPKLIGLNMLRWKYE